MMVFKKQKRKTFYWEENAASQPKNHVATFSVIASIIFDSLVQ